MLPGVIAVVGILLFTMVIGCITINVVGKKTIVKTAEKVATVIPILKRNRRRHISATQMLRDDRKRHRQAVVDNRNLVRNRNGRATRRLIWAA